MREKSNLRTRGPHGLGFDCGWLLSGEGIGLRRSGEEWICASFAAPTLREVEAISHNGMTGSDSQAWVMLRIGRSAVQSHKRKEPVNEENKVCRFGCPCRDDCDSDSGAGRRGKVAGCNTEP